MKFQKNLDVKNKNILLRVDLNIPRVEGKITDLSKIVFIKDTLQDLVNKNNKIYLLSHFGRPEGKVDINFSLKFLASAIENIIQLGKISFVDNCIGEQLKDKISLTQYGEVCLLENVRFHVGEESNDTFFAKELSKNYDIYINDAFSVSHRTHASIVGITKFLPSYGGLLLQKEILALKSILEKPTRPSMAIVGGSKVSTKISLLKNLAKRLDYLAITGGMANTFLASKGYNLGLTHVEEEFFDEVVKIEESAFNSGCKLVLPIDVITSDSLKNTKEIKSCFIHNIGEKQRVFDIGSNSCKAINKLFSKVKTVLWNGPMGAFEYKPFDNSTKIVGKFLSSKIKEYDLNVVVGGGDTVSSLKNLDILDKFSYVSTSGGAFLEWLKGNELPGIKALKDNKLV